MEIYNSLDDWDDDDREEFIANFDDYEDDEFYDDYYYDDEYIDIGDQYGM